MDTVSLFAVASFVVIAISWVGLGAMMINKMLDSVDANDD